MKRKIRAGLIMILCISVAFAFGVLPQKAYAGLDTDTYTFTDGVGVWVNATAGETIDKVVRTPDSGGQGPAYVATIEEDEGPYGMGWSFKICPYSVGTCTFKALDDNGKTIGTVKVIVKQEAVDELFKWDNVMNARFPYGDKYLIIGDESRWEGTEYDLTIDGDSYSGTVDSTGKVPLDKIYPFRTIVTGKIWNNVDPNRSSTYEFSTDPEFALTCYCNVDVRATAKQKNKKKVKIYAKDVHIGDVIKVTYAGKTYTKKVTKNFTDKTMTYTVKMKKKMKNKKWIKFKVTNKFKQEIYYCKTKMVRWDTNNWYDPED